METVLISGATGFLGGYLIDLLRGKYQIIAIGRNTSKKEKIEDETTRFVCCDFTSREQLEPLIKKADYVIHAGALSSAWGRWEDFYQANVVGTKLIAELCVTYHIKRMIYISSPSIYTKKKDLLNIHEDEVDQNNTLNYYIKSKLMAEKLLRETSELKYVILRPRGLIGIGDTSLIPRLLRANEKIGIPLFYGGNNLVDITCVENVAYACLCALVAKDIEGEVFNITNGEPIEFKTILESFFKAIDAKPRYLKLPFPLLYGVACLIEKISLLLSIKKEPNLTRYTVCTLGFSQTLNIDKAKKMLAYEPQISLAEGIINYGNWYKNNKD